MRTPSSAAALAAVIAVALASALILPSAFALEEIPHRGRGGELWAKYQQKLLASRRSAPTPAKAQYFQQLLDHFDGSAETFPQRYFVNSTFYNPERPVVIVQIGGEGPTVDAPHEGYSGELAEMLGAAVVGLEHRFYGDSVPNNDFSVKNLMHLTVENVMEDIANFIRSFDPSQLSATAPSGPLKFFTVGGSYSGALSAWFREAHPELTVASLSSSGVVNAIFEFTEFDEQVAEAAGPDCAASLRAITAAFELAIVSGHFDEVKAMIGAPPHMIDTDFYYMIADSAAMAVQYGHKELLCSAIPSPNTAPSNLTVWFSEFTKKAWGDDFASNCFYDTDCLMNDPSKFQPTSRSWRWQKCYQLAYLQSAPATGSLRSTKLTMDVLLQQCRTVFGIPDMTPATDSINKSFGGATPKETKVVYTNGSDDPWQRAAVKSTLSPTQPEFTAVCNGCGHCGDLEPYANSEAVQQVRAKSEVYIREWVLGSGSASDSTTAMA